MKKITILAAMSLMLANSVFGISLLEKALLPEFKGDLSTVDHKVVESSSDDLIVVINGTTYIVKNK